MFLIWYFWIILKLNGIFDYEDFKKGPMIQVSIVLAPESKILNILNSEFWFPIGFQKFTNQNHVSKIPGPYSVAQKLQLIPFSIMKPNG